MNTTAVFLEQVNRLEARELQPMPDASEAGWDRWVLEVGGADFLSWRRAAQNLPVPAFDRQLRVCVLEE